MYNMNLAEFHQACDRLADTGWTISQIGRLCRFRDRFQQTSLDLPDINPEIRRLAFIRWLVQTGKLSEYTVRENGI